MAICEIEIISTGNEIIYGQLVDTNSSWIAKQSTEQGANVKRLTCVGDNIEDIAQSIERGVLDGRDIIVITGGLGPSDDDLTVEALALALNKKIVYNQKAITMLKEKCTEHTIGLTERRRRMSRSIEGAEPLHNFVGLAPGIKTAIGKCLIIALPGIPKEMKPMFTHYVITQITMNAHKKSLSTSFHISMPLSKFFPILNDIQELFPEAYIKRHAQPPNQGKKIEAIKIDIRVWGEDSQECTKQMNIIRVQLTQLVEDMGGKIIE